MNNIEEQIIALLKKTNTSYKYFFLLACIESIQVNKYEYSFDYLSKVMVAEAFLYGSFVGSRYTKNDRLFDLLEYLVSKNLSFSVEDNYKSIIKLIDDNNDDYVSKMLKQIVLYVPYRLIVTDDFSNELLGLRDSLKNKKISEYSMIYNTIYSIVNRKIIWRKSYYDYILNNKKELKQKIINMIYQKFSRG